MIRTIRLHRELKDQLNYDDFKLDVDTPQELINGLKALVPGFKEYTIKNPNVAILPEGDKKLKKLHLTSNFGKAHTIHVVDTIDGNFDPVSIGVALGFTGFTAFVVGLVINIATSMILSSVAQSLASKPSTNAGTHPADKTPSFIFNQPINVTSQGGAVPIAYGTCLVGSTVIAADLKTVDIAINSTVATQPARKTGYTPPAGTAGNYRGVMGGSYWNTTQTRGESVASVAVTTAGSYSGGAHPTVTFAAPTGGATKKVTATGIAVMEVLSASVANLGSGYSVGNTLTITYNGQTASFTVATTGTGGSVLTVTPANRGEFTATTSDGFTGRATKVAPSGGSGATLYITYRVKYIKITNAGAGYSAVPAITFSGGTAAATATLTKSKSAGYNYWFWY